LTHLCDLHSALVVGDGPAHAGAQIKAAQHKADASADHGGARQRTPIGARLDSRTQDFRVLGGEGDRALRLLSPRTPLLMLAASAGRPARDSVGAGDGK
jgi:hypothetical protein